MINIIKKMISKLKNKFRYTKIHYLLLSFFNKQYVKWIDDEVKFHKLFLKNQKLIFDIGANRGDKTHIFCQFSKKVISFEPEEQMYEILKNRFRKNKKVGLRKLVISDKKGVVDFLSVKNKQAYSSIIKKSILNIDEDNLKIENKRKLSSTLNLQIKKNGRPDYIKIDCEGAELLIVKNLGYNIKIISLESNLPQFYFETIKIIKLMKQKFNSKFNIRINNKFKFSFKENVSDKKIMNFLKQKKLVCEVFIFND